jgi:hypothetical protein
LLKIEEIGPFFGKKFQRFKKVSMYEESHTVSKPMPINEGVSKNFENLAAN